MYWGGGCFILYRILRVSGECLWLVLGLVGWVEKGGNIYFIFLYGGF